MSDHQPLHDAFAEYERRADAVGGVRDTRLTAGSRASRLPMILVAASVALVLVVAGGVAWLAGGNGSTKGTGAPAAGPPNAPVSSTLQPSVLSSNTSAPRSSGPSEVQSVGSSSVPPPSSNSSAAVGTPTGPQTPPTAVRTPPTGTGSRGGGVPSNAMQMQRAFRRVLGQAATFTVTQHYGNYLIGILTATRSGAEGGYDIQAYGGKPGDEATCEDPGKHSRCTISTPAQGGSLAVESEMYSGGSDVLYYVDYVFPDGATFAMHLSNRADPKGAGRTFGPKPPLTLQRMTAIIESPKWGQN